MTRDPARTVNRRTWWDVTEMTFRSGSVNTWNTSIATTAFWKTKKTLLTPNPPRRKNPGMLPFHRVCQRRPEGWTHLWKIRRPHPLMEASLQTHEHVVVSPVSFFWWVISKCFVWNKEIINSGDVTIVGLDHSTVQVQSGDVFQSLTFRCFVSDVFNITSTSGLGERQSYNVKFIFAHYIFYFSHPHLFLKSHRHR